MKFIVFLLACLATFGAAVTFGREYDAAYFSRSSEFAVFDALATNVGTPAVPLSSRSMRELFETCGAVLQSFSYKFQIPETQHAVDASCAGLARAALERSPTYAGAHTILMLSSSTETESVESLLLSKLTAPRESWHAKLRLRKGLPLYGTGLQKLDRALDSDIAFMVQSAGGRKWLARLYDSEPDFRPTIVAVIDRSSNAAKAAFLQEVRRLGKD